MPALIFIIVAFAFWIHAERKLGIGKRFIGGIVFWGGCLFYLHYAHNVGANYERTYVAWALKNVAADAGAERKEDCLKLAEAYEKRAISGGQLILDSKRILNRSILTMAEQDAAPDP